MTLSWSGKHQPPLGQHSFARRAERLVGFLLTVYIAVQGFGLPVLGFGPWPLWQTLADLSFWAALITAALYSAPVRQDLQLLWKGVLLIFGLSALSLVLLFIMQDGHLDVALPFGIFQVYKLFQLTAMFWIVSRLSLSAGLLRTWGRVATAGFLFTAATVTWTYFSPFLPKLLGQILPGSGVPGPWDFYYQSYDPGLGTLSYNHGFVASMLLLQGAFAMLMRADRSNSWLLLLVVLTCFLSGARAGLVGAVVFVFLEGIRTPLRSTLMILLVGLGGIFALPYLQTDLDKIIARQSTILEAGNTENLAGRAEIWQSYLRSLLDEPVRLLLGSGMGSGIGNHGVNAHMMVLQVLYDTGLAGLSVMVLFFGVLMSQLHRLRQRRASMALNLLISLWITTVATETLFPNPAFGSFLPMLTLVMIVALTPLATGHPQPPFRKED